MAEASSVFALLVQASATTRTRRTRATNALVVDPVRRLPLVFVGLVSLVGACGDTADGAGKATISFVGFEALTRELANRQGKPTLINLWALW